MVNETVDSTALMNYMRILNWTTALEPGISAERIRTKTGGQILPPRRMGHRSRQNTQDRGITGSSPSSLTRYGMFSSSGGEKIKLPRLAVDGTQDACYFRNVMKRLTKRPRVCRYCQNALHRSGRGRPPRYCSAACRQGAYRRRSANDSYPLRLIHQGFRQILLSNQIRNMLRKELQKIGLLDGPKKSDVKPAEPPNRPTLQLVKRTTPPNGD
jgi:hypothetical protein